jgi:hypothetical protein
MKIALLTEGRGEFKAFPGVLDKLATRSGHVFLPPSLVDIHPLAKPTVVAKACLPVLRTFRHLLHVLGDPAYADQCRRPASA